MEWVIPLQRLEVTKVQLGPLIIGPKPLASVSYIDGQTQFPSLSILLPHLVVKSYDSNTGKLALILQPVQALQKLQALQSTLLSYVYTQQAAWFNQEHREMAELSRLFQPMIEGDVLHLYCPVSVQDKKSGGVDSIVVYRSEKGGPIQAHQGVRPTFLQPGDLVRVALRIQGLSFHTHPTFGSWSGRFRLQHKIMALFIKAA